MTSLVGRLQQVLEADADGMHFVQPDAVGVGLLLVGTLPVAWRYRAPLLMLLVTSASSVLYHELGYAPPPLPYGPLVVLYAVAVLWPPLSSLAVVATLVAGVLPLYLTLHTPITDDEFIAYALSFGLAWAFGYGMQLNRARTGLLEERAVQLAREQQLTAQLAVQQERARIARDLHDLVSHHVGVIVAQASAVQRVLSTQPEQGLQALRSIEQVGRRAMVEMRRLMGVLQPAPTPVERPAGLGLDGIGPLLADARRAGLAVELVVEGTARQLPAEVEGHAYLIVQEALTNALKHAGPGRAEVLIGYEPGRLRLRIRDEGRAGPRPAAGHGLTGVVHRVTVLGGRLAVGPLPSGGYELAADLPLPRQAA
jgi:signal transduction histidine kinase